MRLSLPALGALVLVAACSTTSSGPPPAAEQRAIADSLARQVKAAYDLSKPDVEARLMDLYAPTGRVVSASAGQVSASRESLAMGIKAFWENVGVNMRQPKWRWDEMLFDVPARNVAIMTAKYHIDHFTPQNQPHTISGAWTAVFEKRGDRWYVIQEHLSDLPTQTDSMAGHTMPPTHSGGPG